MKKKFLKIEWVCIVVLVMAVVMSSVSVGKIMSDVQDVRHTMAKKNLSTNLYSSEQL